MTFIVRLLLITFTCFLISLIMPWWGMIIAAFIVSFFIPDNSLNVFLSGFMGTGLLWMVMAWKIDIETKSIMSQKMLLLLPFNDVIVLVIATGVIGGLAGATGAICGNSLRQMFDKKKEKSFYN